MAALAPVFANPSVLSTVNLHSLTSDVSNITVALETVREAITQWTTEAIVDNDALVSLYRVDRKGSLPDFYIERSLNILNANHRWIQGCADREDYESVISFALKDDWLFAKNWDITNMRMELLGLYDFATALKMLTENVAILRKLKNETVVLPYPVLRLTDEEVGERALSHMIDTIYNDSMRTQVARDALTAYDKILDFDPAWRPPYDPRVNYDTYNAPVTDFELQFMNMCRELINDWYINVHDLRNFLTNISTSAYRIDMEYTQDRINKLGNPEAVRVLNQPYRKVNRNIYLLSVAAALRARNELYGRLKARLIFRDPHLVMQSVTTFISTSVVARNVQSLFVNDISSVQVQPTISKCWLAMANPRLTQIAFTEFLTKETFSLTSLYGALIALVCLPAASVDNTARKFVCDYFARFIMLYTPPDRLVDLPEELRQCIDPARWYASPSNKLHEIYIRLGMFAPAVREFVELFFRVNIGNIGADARNADTVPWSMGAERENPLTIRMWRTYAQRIRYDSIDPITMWHEDQLTNFCPAHLGNLINAFERMLLSHDKSRNLFQKDFITRASMLMMQSIDGINQYFVKWLEASFAIALSPFSHNSVDDGNCDFVPPDIKWVSLKDFVSVMLFLQSDVVFMYPVQPDLSGDPKFQLVLPIIVGMYHRVETALGQIATRYTRTQKFNMAIEIVQKLRPMPFDDILEYYRDPSETKRLLKYVTDNDMPDEVRSILNKADTISGMLNDMRFTRGLRPHFYIAKFNTHFLPVVAGLNTAFMTTAFPYNGEDPPAPYVIKKTYTGLELLDAKISSVLKSSRTANTFSSNQLAFDMMTLRTTDNPASQLVNDMEGEGCNARCPPVIEMIKVKHPCYLDLSIQKIEDGHWKAPTYTSLESVIVDLEKAISRNFPFKINGELQYLSMGTETINAMTINMAYTNMSLIVFTDLYPLPTQFITPTEFVRQVNNPVSFRKRDEVFTTLNDIGVRFVRMPITDM